MLKIKHNTKSRGADPDTQAIGFLAIAFALFIAFICVCLLLIFKIDFRRYGTTIILASGVLNMGFASWYFGADRQRRNRIIDEFRDLSHQQKRRWRWVAFMAFAGPLIFFWLFHRNPN